MNLEKNVVPTVSHFMSLGFSREAIGRMLGRTGTFLRASLEKVDQRIALLESFGLARDQALHVIEYAPNFITKRYKKIKS